MLMRLLSLFFLILAGFVCGLRGGEPEGARYTAVVSGIVCQECKATVASAIRKLPGVKDLEFAKGPQPGSQKLTFASSSAQLTREDAARALGEHAREFNILSFDRSKDEHP